MAEPHLRIALVGGIPASLGGGGLELQIRRTRDALAVRGHQAFRVEAASDPEAFDVLHAFGVGPIVTGALEHWRRSPAPLVVSPVVVVPPGWLERRHLIASRLPLPAFGPRASRDLLRRADAVVALTEHERRFLARFVGRGAPQPVVVPNGVDLPASAGADRLVLPERYVLLLGTVSARKRQAEVLAALRASPIPAVVVGGFEGADADRRAWERTVTACDAHWMGEVQDRATVAEVVRRAQALVHFSAAEGQSLAVLEALAAGTTVLASDLPANVELAARYPRHVRLVSDLGELARAVGALGTSPGPAPIPTWDDVAALLEGVYAAAGVRAG